MTEVVQGLLFGIVVACAVAGIGCMLAVLAVVFPRVAAAVDRQARAGTPTVPLLLGSLVVVGVLAVLSGASHFGGKTGGGLAFLLLGLPALLLLLAGSTATVPLLGERLLGARGPSRSPLIRAILGAVTLGAAILPTLAGLHFLTVLLGCAVFGWPVGVALASLLGRRGAKSTPGTTSP
jgi:hypothetical protein